MNSHTLDHNDTTEVMEGNINAANHLLLSLNCVGTRKPVLVSGYPMT